MLDVFRRKEYVVTVDARPEPELVQQAIRNGLALPPYQPSAAPRAARGSGRACATSPSSAAAPIPELAGEICAKLRTPLHPVRLRRFANDCLEVQLQANCRERDVFLIQPIVPPVQEHLVELLLMTDAARGASAARVTVVMPHYAYARSDKKDEPRSLHRRQARRRPARRRGASRVLTMTLHSPQVHGFFSVPVDHLHALRELAAHFRGQDLAGSVVVSPDLGNARSAAAFARQARPAGGRRGQGAAQRHERDDHLDHRRRGPAAT